ncbi:unnamed protein product [Trichobilharzia regenti]|nr:unnamed protein product [Trichobilharzia regenti]
MNRSLCNCRQLIIQIDDNQQELPPVTKEKNLKRTKRMNIGFSLSIAYACSIGGIATTIGTPANSILQGQVYKYDFYAFVFIISYFYDYEIVLLNVLITSLYEYFTGEDSVSIVFAETRYSMQKNLCTFTSLIN